MKWSGIFYSHQIVPHFKAIWIKQLGFIKVKTSAVELQYFPSTGCRNHETYNEVFSQIFWRIVHWDLLGGFQAGSFGELWISKFSSVIIIVKVFGTAIRRGENVAFFEKSSSSKKLFVETFAWGNEAKKQEWFLENPAAAQNFWFRTLQEDKSRQCWNNMNLEVKLSHYYQHFWTLLVHQDSEKREKKISVLRDKLPKVKRCWLSLGCEK